MARFLFRFEVFISYESNEEHCLDLQHRTRGCKMVTRPILSYFSHQISIGCKLDLEDLQNDDFDAASCGGNRNFGKKTWGEI